MTIQGIQFPVLSDRQVDQRTVHDQTKAKLHHVLATDQVPALHEDVAIKIEAILNEAECRCTQTRS